METLRFVLVPGVQGEDERFFSGGETGGRDGGTTGFERPAGRCLREGMQTQTRPHHTKPIQNQAKPSQTITSQATRNQTKPNQTKPTQTKPNQTKSNQTKPNQTKNKPNQKQTRPNQTKPNQTKPNRTKPNRTKLRLIIYALDTRERRNPGGFFHNRGLPRRNLR